MSKPKMHSADLLQRNIAAIRRIFPGCVTESRGVNGALQLAVDLGRLHQELAGALVAPAQERYQLDWPGKHQALLSANTPSSKTLRPCREESEAFDTTGNLFIEGDNLDALKLLQEAYLGRIKMIYIDPPYNTGKDFVYTDDFNGNIDDVLPRANQVDAPGKRLASKLQSGARLHSNWLSMMYARLKLSRSLLREDGVVVVHIDENEHCNLEKILAEIFGEMNNLGTIIWDKRNPKGDASGVAQQHETICIYCKNREVFKQAGNFKRPKENAARMLAKARRIIQEEGGITDRARKQYRDWLTRQAFTGGEKAYNQIDDNGDVYRLVSMAWPNKRRAPDDYFVPLIHPLTGKPCALPERGWRAPPASMQKLLRSERIVFGPDETTQPTRKYLLKDNLFENVPSLLYYGGSDDALLAQLDVPFDTPKPLHVAKRLIRPLCRQDDILLDFFAGSCTAAHAVMQLNTEDGGRRRFIMVQLPEPCTAGSEARRLGYSSVADIGKDRLRKAADSIRRQHQSALPMTAGAVDLGFRVLKVDSSNMMDAYYNPDGPRLGVSGELVDSVKANRTPEDLLFQLMLDCGVEPSRPVAREVIGDKEVFFVDGNAMAACLDAQGDIDETFLDELAQRQPRRAILRAAGFKDSAVKIKAEEIFKAASPFTEVQYI